MKKGIKIILASVLILLIIFGVMFISKNNKIKSEIKEENNSGSITETEEIGQGTLGFLKSIVGVKAESLEIINKPVMGIKGSVFAPEEAIVKGINYFLQQTNNNKMKNLKIDIEDNTIDIYVNYNVKSDKDIPIKMKIKPSLNESKDLVIDIGEVKVLDLKVANFIVNLVMKTFVIDWFDNSNIKVEYGKNNVIISKENFKNVNLNSIEVKNEGILLDMIINLEN